MMTSCYYIGRFYSVGTISFFVEPTILLIFVAMLFLCSDVTDCDLFVGVIDLFLFLDSADLSMLFISRSVGFEWSTLFW